VLQQHYQLMMMVFVRGAESAVKTQNFPKRKTYFEKFPHSKIFLKIFRLHNFSKISLDQKIFPKRAFPHTGRFFTTGVCEDSTINIEFFFTIFIFSK
jgi:hypothetical protein